MQHGKRSAVVRPILSQDGQRDRVVASQENGVFVALQKLGHCGLQASSHSLLFKHEESTN